MNQPKSAGLLCVFRSCHYHQGEDSCSQTECRASNKQVSQWRELHKEELAAILYGVPKDVSTKTKT